jgi:hypothetical protein
MLEEAKKKEEALIQKRNVKHEERKIQVTEKRRNAVAGNHLEPQPTSWFPHDPALDHVPPPPSGKFTGKIEGFRKSNGAFKGAVGIITPDTSEPVENSERLMCDFWKERVLKETEKQRNGSLLFYAHDVDEDWWME